MVYGKVAKILSNSSFFVTPCTVYPRKGNTISTSYSDSSELFEGNEIKIKQTETCSYFFFAYEIKFHK